MAGKPKPSFWIVVFVIVIGLVGYSLYNAGIFSKDEIPPITETKEPLAPKAKKYRGKVEVTIASSVTKQKWLLEMVDEFHRMGKKTSRGSKIILKPGKKGVLSGGSMLKSFDLVKVSMESEPVEVLPGVRKLVFSAEEMTFRHDVYMPWINNLMDW